MQNAASWGRLRVYPLWPLSTLFHGYAFFYETLVHLSLAPGQLSLNGWRVMVGFVTLRHKACLRSSLALCRLFWHLLKLGSSLGHISLNG